ncbi:MAG: GFA family protein [Pseudomonadota bacterium]
MDRDKDIADGGCLCGAIRFQAVGAEKGAGYCHCESCRRHTGAPVVAFVVYGADQVRWLKGDRTRYQSSPAKFRSFCGACGASLTFEDCSGGGTALVEFHISAMDNPNAFPPNEHTHEAERISWLALSDDLPRYRGSMRID